MTSTEIDAAHGEVLAALEAAAPDDPGFGERIRLDRGSALRHLGLRTPVRRKIVARGFSFSAGSSAERIATWDGIWRRTDCADVMFAVLDDHRDRLRDGVDASFWPRAVDWIDRIDNWAHADDLARVYSWVLAAEPDVVHPQLERWNDDTDEWKRRISLVSLIHYSGKHAVFVEPERVFPLVERCLDDDRASVQKAVGWVVRETNERFPAETRTFLTDHGARMSRDALRRATERMDPGTRSRLRS